MPRYYRVHPAAEPLDTILDHARPDGWVASDEVIETQPHGVSACGSLDDLEAYCRMYSLCPQPGDRVVEIIGRSSYDRDRDQYAVRVIAREVRRIGDAQAFLAAWEVDLDVLADEIEEDGEVVALSCYAPAVLAWLKIRRAD